MIQIISIVLPIFLVLATGNILMKTGLMNEDFISTSNRLIFEVLLPVLLFNEIARSDFQSVFSPVHIMVMLSAIGAVFLLSFLVARLAEIPGEAAGTFATSTFRANLAYLGLPVCLYAFGGQALTMGSVLMGFSVPVTNILSIIALNIGARTRPGWKLFLKDAVLNPIFIACVLGLVFAVAGIKMPSFVERTLSIISGVTLPLALFAIGATTSLEKLKGSVLGVGLGVVVKLAVQPLLAFLFLKGLGLEMGLLGKVVVVMLASPSASVNYILVSEMHGDVDLANGIIVATTVLSVLSFMIWLSILGPAAP